MDESSHVMPEHTPEHEFSFLFTDIERSTALVHRLGGDYRHVLAESRALLRRAVAEHGGREVECRADESFSVFDSANDAVRAAAAAQRALISTSWPGGAIVRVRMGVHTGTAADSGHGLVGLDVHRAARLSAAGHGGQVILSEQTVADAGVAAEELGYYELPGLPEPERLYQLSAEGLPADFPELRLARRVDDGRLRVVLADDSMLIRDGIAKLLEEAGMQVVAQASSGDELLERVAATEPDVAVVDIRMPPSGSDEGVRAAQAIRKLHPETGVLLLSQDLVPAYARELLEASDGGVGYLLKDRVADMVEFADALRRVAAGEIVLDAEIDALASGPS
jgi:class 3 adenylate cyclase/ActR/RegA family two-component response regulator